MRKLIDFLDSTGIDYMLDEPLSAHTSFRIGGNAGALIEVKNEDELKKVITFLTENSLEYFVIGNGSNLLVADDGFSGAVVHLGGAFAEIKCEGERLFAGAGAKLISLCTLALENSLTGFEFAYGIPGSVGGAVFMNAGAYGGEIRDVVDSVTAIDRQGNLKTYRNEELLLSHRHSIFDDNGEIILFASFVLKKGDKDEIKAKMSDLMSRRKDKQPLEFPSAGSTFKRPEGYFAGALIEQSGLKGYAVGGAQVSEKHAGFIINKGGATCKDVIALIRHCQKIVKDNFGVDLETEVKIV